jgi:hypothetical protein
MPIHAIAFLGLNSPIAFPRSDLENLSPHYATARTNADFQGYAGAGSAGVPFAPPILVGCILNFVSLFSNLSTGLHNIFGVNCIGSCLG